jgi:hypothetical protein
MRRALVYTALLSAATAAPLAQRLAAPAYWYPSTAPSSPWARAVDSAPPLDIVVMNPASGPGARADPAYAAQVARAHAASPSLSVIGYVHTSYGRRAPADVHADVAAFYAFYDIDGIFVDEVSASAADAPYYAALAAFIRTQLAPDAARGAGKARAGAPAAPLLVLNPGTNVDEALEPAFDVVVGFEGPLAAYFDFEPAAWLRNTSAIAAARVWHIVHSVSELPGNATGLLAAAVARAKVNGAGWVFATNATLPNPYAGLPGEIFWEDLERWATGMYL